MPKPIAYPRPMACRWLLGLVLVLAACHETGPDSTLSLRQARDAGGEAVRPAALADITAILDQERPDPGLAQRFRAAADQAPPPAGSDAATLARFYGRRAQAADAIGRLGQEVSDLQTAVAQAEQAPEGDDLSELLGKLARAQALAGQPREALIANRRQIEVIEATEAHQGRLLGAYFRMIKIFLDADDLASARSSLDQLRALLAVQRGKKSYSRNGRVWELFLALSEARVTQKTGRLVDAETAFRAALAVAEPLAEAGAEGGGAGQPEDAAFDLRQATMSEFAMGVLVPEGRLLDAELMVRRALLSDLERRGRFSGRTAADLYALARVIFEQGRLGDAEKLIRAAIDTDRQLGQEPNSAHLAGARAYLGLIQAESGQGAAALSTFDALDRDVAGDAGLRSRLFDANPGYAIALMAGGRPAAAIPVFRRAIERLSGSGDATHPRVAILTGELGLAQAATGDRDAALVSFRAALPGLSGTGPGVLSDSGGDDAGVGQRETRRQAILKGQIQALIDSAPANGAAVAGELFRLADLVRGQAVQKAVAAAAARLAVGGGALAALVRRDQDSAGQLALQQSLLIEQLSLPSEQQDAAMVRRLSAETLELAAARRAIGEDLRRSFPRYADLSHPSPPDIATIQAALRPTEAMVAFLVRDQDTLVWAIPARGSPGFVIVPLGQSQLAALVSALRQRLDTEADDLTRMPAYDLAGAYRLYDALLRPLAPVWGQARTLILVPDKALGQLPFAALVTAPATLPADPPGQPLFAQYRGIPWLVRTVATVQVPSANALLALRTTAGVALAPKPFLGFGDPWFNAEEANEGRRDRGAGARPAARGAGAIPRRPAPSRDSMRLDLLTRLPRLPETAGEVREAAQSVGADSEQDVILGDQFNERTLATLRLDDRRILMFATHGLMAGDLPGLAEPALAVSSPAISGLASGTGLLRMSDVLGLKLNADWVVLSACNTAAGAGQGAEAISGLGRAFFYAGSRALLVTQWQVESTSATRLTTGTFRHQAEQPGLSRAEALRLTELDLIDQGVYRDSETAPPAFSYAHPMFWAPYTLVGDGG